MILRRPYAFLIKHFRLIHMIIFILMAYITYKSNNVLTFFNDYITLDGNIEVLSSNYINTYIYLFPVIIIILSLIIYFLMRYKKKPKAFYIYLIIMSIITIVVYSYLYLNIKNLEIIAVSAKQIRLYRDIARIFFYTLVVTCIPILIRGLGFDIKKFNFSSDLKELNLNKEDNAEVEVNVDLSGDALKRRGRRQIRELKYYYAENKFIINIILTILVFVLIMIFPFNKYVINRNLNEGEVLGSSYFNLKVTESYITSRNQTSKNNNYVILKVSLLGKVSEYTLDLDHFVLEGTNNKYNPSKKYYLYFKDLGIGYRDNILNLNEYKDYLLIYNINVNDKNSDFVLTYLSNNKKINVKPKVIE